jgi:hypothetical protein
VGDGSETQRRSRPELLLVPVEAGCATPMAHWRHDPFAIVTLRLRRRHP